MMQVLRNANFLSFFTSRTLANFADSIYFIALLWIVQTTFHSPAFTGFTFTALSLAAVFSFAFGPLIDRISAAALSGVALLAQGIILLFIPVLTGQSLLSFSIILVLVLVASLFAAVFYPANMSLIPQILEDKDKLVQGNALVSSSDQLINLIGFLLGGTLVAWIGASQSFYVASGAMLAGSILFFLLTRRMKAGKPSRTDASSGSSSSSPASYMAEIKEGLHFLWGNLFLRVLMLLNLVANFSIALLIIALPSLGESYGSAFYYSAIYVAFFFGMIIGALMTNSIKKTGMNISLFWIGSGLALMLFFVLPHAIGWKVISIALFGLCSGVVNVLQMSFIQLLTEERMMGRVMSSVTTMSNIAIPLGSLIGSSLALQLRIETLFLLAGSLIIGCGAVMLMIRSVRRFTADSIQPSHAQSTEVAV
ncbi:MFS transporter [Paenibacillus puerhi]|uniref:MFS transporter n=1 Tax=Paenibacillus puerhi TaxID=2692622 RepID=UPI0013575F01|nr:MFS transporter [Paenibacillus puerhi]